MKKAKQLEREAKQLFRFCMVEGVLDEGRVREAVRKVLEAKRRGALALLAHFRRLLKLERLRHTAEVASATFCRLPYRRACCRISSADMDRG